MRSTTSQPTVVRATAVVAFLIGCTLITLGVLLPRYVASEKSVPLDLASTTLSLHDPAASVGKNYQAPGAEGPVTAPVTRQFNLGVSAPADKDTASARVGVSTARSDVDDDLQSLLDAQVWSFELDRRTGEARGQARVADTPAMPAMPARLEGAWVKFPQSTEQKTYPYFDATLRAAVPAEFTGTTHREDGKGKNPELYVFRQEIQPTNVATKYNGLRNTINVDIDGKSERAYLTHSGWRELVVEPRTGLIVSVEEDLRDVYHTADGRPVEDLLIFHGKTSEEAGQAMLQQAEKLGGDRNIKMWGIALLSVGVIMAAVSLVLAIAYRPRRRRLPGGDDIPPLN